MLMLANTYEQQRVVGFPCVMQPKLDGVRAVWQNQQLQSKAGKVFNHLEHITVELLGISQQLDGELYSPTLPLPKLVALLNKKKLNKTELKQMQSVKLHVFDHIADGTFNQRYKALPAIIAGKQHLALVENVWVDDGLQLKAQYDAYLNAAYEGAMIRKPDSLYTAGRSDALLKLKPFFEAEFIIQNVVGVGVLECLTADGKPFHASIKGWTYKDKEQAWLKPKPFIGKPATIRHLGLLASGKPRSAQAVAIRDYE